MRYPSFPRVTGVNWYFGQGEEKQAAAQAKAKQKTLVRKKTSSSVPENELPDSGPALPEDVTEMPHHSDTAPAENGPLPGDRYPTPQPEGAHHTKPHRGKKKEQQGGQKVAEFQRLPGLPSDGKDPITGLDDAKVISSEVPDDGSNPPEKEVIDLTIKEESRSPTPTSPARAAELGEDPAGLKAGWVCLQEFFISMH